MTNTTPDTSCDNLVPWQYRERSAALIALVVSRGGETHSLYCADHTLADIEENDAANEYESTPEFLIERGTENIHLSCRCHD